MRYRLGLREKRKQKRLEAQSAELRSKTLRIRLYVSSLRFNLEGSVVCRLTFVKCFKSKFKDCACIMLGRNKEAARPSVYNWLV